MKKRIFIKIAFQVDLSNIKIIHKSGAHYRSAAISRSQVCHWKSEIFIEREELNDARKSGRFPDFICYKGIRNALKQNYILLSKILRTQRTVLHQVSLIC
jgi:hypothetical protein